jgi:hypothetical protein
MLQNKNTGKSFQFAFFVFCIAALLPVHTMAQTAGLTVGAASGLPGSTISVPITFTPGSASVSIPQFDLLFPSSVTYTGVTTGSAAQAVGKTALGNSIAGGARFLVSGGVSPIGSGQIATVQFVIHGDAPAGKVPVNITGIVCASPEATAVPAIGVHGSVTVAAVADGTPPTISSVTSIGIMASAATITWTTNEAADTQVEYGTSTSYDRTSTLNGTLTTSHLQALTGLDSNTTYHYRVKSKDEAGNPAVSSDFTFTTSKSGEPPVISDISVTGITGSSVTIGWTTDVSADSRVEFWLIDQPLGFSGLGDLATTHSITINDLQKSSQYHFHIKSTDSEGKIGVSPDLVFTTGNNGTLLVAMPLFASANGQNENDDDMFGIALASKSANPANLVFAAFDSNGNLINGPGIDNPVSRQLNPGTQNAILDMEIFGDGFENNTANGWIMVQSDNPDVVGFYLGFDRNNTEMDGTSFGYAPLKDMVLTEIEPAGLTRINLANTSIGSANVTINLMQADGTVRSSRSRTISGEGAVVADLYTDLFDGIQPNQTDYVLVRSTQGLQSFELLKPNSGDMASLGGQDLAAGGTALYSPQYAVGGSYRTSLSVINLDSRPGTVTLQLFGENGVQIGASRVVVLNALGKIRIDDPNFFATLDSETVTTGYVQIQSDGVRLAGSTVFANRDGQSFSSALPLIYNLKTSLTFSQVASNDLYFTGIAVLNPNLNDASVTIELFSEDGHRIGQKVELVPGAQKVAKLVTEYFPSLVGQNRTSGYIRLTSSKPIASFALFGTNNLTVLSAIPGQ